MTTWETPGEAMAGRKLERDPRIRDHFAPGQHQAEEQNGRNPADGLRVATVTYVGPLGSVIRLAVVRMDGGEWELASDLCLTAGVMLPEHNARLGSEFKLTDDMREALRRLDDE